MSIFPWIVYYYLRKYYDLLGREGIITKWGSLYEEVDYSKSKGACCNIIVFFLRRFSYSIAIVFLDFNPLIQLGFCYLSSALVTSIQCLIYLLYFKPYPKKDTQYVQTAVESLIFVCFCLLNVFIYDISEELSDIIEYIIMSCMLSSVGILFIVDIVSTIHTLITKIINRRRARIAIKTQDNQNEEVNISSQAINQTQVITFDNSDLSLGNYHSVSKEIAQEP